ncbi:hypothetical protein BDV40DRAFT_267835 [Aspergillus tamarii]|uniref:Uncharacterized protein n=1 Tax=Aspergillus tamarii TaxID=41984 RepID=A0A5N6URZ7_ASPTM|nr:hypothetical protein BDV40DRAFT_267835 [Aspergillus tamarii]
MLVPYLPDSRLDKEKEKGHPCRLAGRAKFPTHSYYLVNNNNNNNHDGRISFSVCAVLHQIHSGHGAVLITILSSPDLHLYSILIPLFLLDQTSHAPQFIHLKLEKESPLGGCLMHPWQQGKVLVESSPTSDRLGPPDYQSACNLPPPLPSPSPSMLGYMTFSTLIKQTTCRR